MKKVLLITFVYMSVVLSVHAAASFSSAKSTYESYLKKIETAHSSNLSKLGVQYAQVLESTMDAYQQQGDLEGVLAAKKEKERFKKEKTVPRLPDSESSAITMGLQALYWKTAEQAVEYRDQKKIGLAKKYQKNLDGLVKSLTRQSKLEEAMSAKKESNKIKMMIEVASFSTEAMGDADKYEKVSCSTCGGSGVSGNPCTKCYKVTSSSTSSSYRSYSSTPSGKCIRCKGTTKVAASFSGGFMTCMTCKGSGKCVTCKGAGTIGTTCSACKGKGKILRKKTAAIQVANVEIVKPKPVIRAKPVNKASGGKVDVVAFRNEMDAYLKDLRSIMTSFKAGQAEQADLRTAVTTSTGYTGKVLKSTGYVKACHPKQVVVLFEKGGRTGVAFSPHNLSTGQKAEGIFKSNKGIRPVQVTYGMLSTGQRLLLDIDLQ